MNAKLATVGALLLATGALLARTKEAGIEVARIELATGPALRVAPVGSATRPTALLAHGITASKETLFALAETLAASGFECLLVDFPGHGESRVPFRGDLGAVLVEGARTLGGEARVDVVLGHSMGAYVAARALATRRLDAKLLVALGAVPRAPCETLLLVGSWDELVSAPPQAVVSPWSDHVLEPWDPVLVSAAARAACAKVGRTPVAVARPWLRALGALMVLAAALLLLAALTPPRKGALTGAGVAAIALTFPALGLPLFFAGAPTRAHLPLQVAAGALLSLASLVLSRLTGRPARVVQGGIAALPVLLAASRLIGGDMFGAFIGTLLAGVVGLGWALGAFAETRTRSAAAGHVAFGVFLGYLLGQWCPRFV